MSRVKKSIKNIIYNSLTQIVIIILGFVVRKYLINILGTQYLGINGLFTNLISILSLAELGIGTSIIYSLYKPLNDKDYNKIIILMNFFKKAYRLIGITITILGLCLVPFLDKIIKDDLSFININLIFLLYLLQTISTYFFFAYKSSLIKANQKEYIISQINCISTIFTSIIQILSLIIFKSFTIYVIIIIISNILRNLFISLKVNENYPYIRNKFKDKLPMKEKKQLYKNCYALFIYKINGIILKSTDNIILSAFIGLNIIGIYSNYILIISTIKKILNMFYQSISAAIGNLDASSTKEKKRFIFDTTILISSWLFGVASIGVFVLANKFVLLWLGNDYVLNKIAITLISIDLLTYGFMKTSSIFRSSLGLFQQGKYRPLIGSIINLLISLLLVKKLGLVGVLIGTFAANMLTRIWYDPYIIYKHAFSSCVKNYYIKMVKLLFQIILSSIICYYICSLISITNILTFLTQVVICISITSFVIWIGNRKSDEFMYIKNTCLALFKEKFAIK